MDFSIQTIDGEVLALIAPITATKADIRLWAAAPALLEALTNLRGILRSLQPALNVMAREVMDDIIKDQIDTSITAATHPAQAPVEEE